MWACEFPKPYTLNPARAFWEMNETHALLVFRMINCTVAGAWGSGVQGLRVSTQGLGTTQFRVEGLKVSGSTVWGSKVGGSRLNPYYLLNSL